MSQRGKRRKRRYVHSAEMNVPAPGVVAASERHRTVVATCMTCLNLQQHGCPVRTTALILDSRCNHDSCFGVISHNFPLRYLLKRDPYCVNRCILSGADQLTCEIAFDSSPDYDTEDHTPRFVGGTNYNNQSGGHANRNQYFQVSRSLGGSACRHSRACKC